jgi:hypothetical protein|tara:strand:- start:8191 stop:8379 length:189 start_codon:yes stop_codon:yes gene_type:complete
MKAVKKEVEVKATQLTAQEAQALSVLVQAVRIATKLGSFELEDAVVIGNAKSILEKLIPKKS